MRITNKVLENKIERLNKLTDRPLTSWTRADGRSTANIGNFHLYSASGFVSLHEVSNAGGGVNHLYSGTKKELDSFIDGMIKMHYIING